MRLESKFKKNLLWINEFYLDNYDVEDGISDSGKYNYYDIINIFSKFGMIPVTALDRHPKHIDAINHGFQNELFSYKKVALRLTRDYFCNFDLVKDEIDEVLGKLSQHINSVDFIFDCRVCKTGEAENLSKQIINFISRININISNLSLDRIIITGSMIPPSISELINTQSELDVEREEIKIYTTVDTIFKGNYNLIFGDYGCVSPEYSDIELFDEDMQNVTTAKILYPYSNRLFIRRGGRVKGDKFQYNVFAAHIINNSSIYRGKEFSTGDLYLHQKANYEGKTVTAASIVKPLVNLHLSYMILER